MRLFNREVFRGTVYGTEQYTPQEEPFEGEEYRVMNEQTSPSFPRECGVVRKPVQRWHMLNG
jgi:hypothetical protein